MMTDTDPNFGVPKTYGDVSALTYWNHRARNAEALLKVVSDHLDEWNEGSAVSADDPHVIKAIDAIAEARVPRSEDSHGQAYRVHKESK